MHYFIFPNKDSYITETSPTYVTEYADSVSKNYGYDEIVELKKNFENSYATGAYNVSRILIQFDYSGVEEEITKGNITNPKYYLRMYEIEGQKETQDSYVVGGYMLSQSWDEGTGKRFDDKLPISASGVTWESASYGHQWFNMWNSGSLVVTFGSYYSEFDSTDVTFGSATASVDFIDTGSRASMGGIWFRDEGFEASQSFTNQSPDIEMDITDIAKKHINEDITNNGLILKFSGSYEGDSTPQHLKFFSRHTHTIYSPKLEVRWDDSNYTSTSSLTHLTMSGVEDNYFYIKGLQKNYRESEKVKFRIGARKKYEQKTFQKSMLTSSFIVPKDSMEYSIIDVGTNTPIVPFGNYTSMSCDGNGMYFNQWFNTFEPGRYYKVLFKVIYDGNQEVVYDNNEEFKII